MCEYDCGAHGTCVQLEPGKNVCKCDPKWEGETCRREVCPCLNGGGCYQSYNGSAWVMACLCPKELGWTGPLCDQPYCNHTGLSTETGCGIAGVPSGVCKFQLGRAARVRLLRHRLHGPRLQDASVRTAVHGPERRMQVLWDSGGD